MTLKVRDIKKEITQRTTFYSKNVYALHKKWYGVRVRYDYYKLLMTKVMSKIMDRVLDNNYIFEMPFNLGAVALTEEKTKAFLDGHGNIKRFGTNYPIDNKKSKALGRKGFVFDLDVDKVYKVRWFKGKLKNKSAYYFKPLTEIRTRAYKKIYETS